MTARHALRLDAVGKRFASAAGPVTVLDRVDLAIEPGSFVAVTGPSGSGKTTLLHLAALLDRPSEGRVFFEDADTAGADERTLARLRAERIGMVYQQFHLLPNRSAIDNVLFRFRYLPVARAEARRRAREALATVGLEPIAGRTARLLSGGEMQRVAIARAIAARPALLLADEPTGNLDAAAADRVMDCLARLNAEGLTILLATHNEALAARCPRRIACDAGRVKEGDA